jgi:hypothetical protein
MAQEPAAAGDPMSDDNLPAVQNEIAAIEAEMGTLAYRQDEGKQARLRDLYRRRDGDRGPTILTGDELSIKSPAEFASANPDGDYTAYTRAMREYADVFVHVSDPAAFNAKLEALPDTVTDAMVVELMSGGSAAPEPISDQMLAKLAREPGTQRLAREWGHEARHRFGIVSARLWRAIGMMPEGGADIVDKLLCNLTPDEAEAVYRKLAA